MNIKKISTIILTTIIATNFCAPSVEAKVLQNIVNQIGFYVEYEENNIDFYNILNRKVMAMVSNTNINYIKSPNTQEEMAERLYKQRTTHKIYQNGRFQDASKLDIAKHLMVNPRYETDQFKYQFLRLDSYKPVNEQKLENFLLDKGVFKGHASDFIEAAKENNIDVIYLVSHAMLETGNGTSKLATGTNINGVTYYNFFGINAFDASPMYGGVSLAQKKDWSSISKAIKGGANWISRNYIHSSSNQKTLYEMRFSPMSKDPWHIYATDLKWPDKISTIMYGISDFYNEGNNFNFELVKYR